MSDNFNSDRMPDSARGGVPVGSRASRRDFLKRAAVAMAAPVAVSGVAEGSQSQPPEGAPKQPNILMIISDQFRWDFVGAYGLNPMGVTPNLDSIAGRGVAFQNAMTNQPWCSPSRACLFTGQYATQTGVWRLGPGLLPGTATLATALRSQGYTCNYIGKWHLAPHEPIGWLRAHHETGYPPKGSGFVPSEYRGGFLDLWEAANVVELTSSPYEGTIWNGKGEPMHWKDTYRVDYFTDLAVRFLRQPQKKPFFLVVSQIEPHGQNPTGHEMPPKKYQDDYVNPFVPHDLRFFPGEWQKLLPGYYGDIKAIDDSVGVLLKTLSDEHLAENTIVIFISDHGSHFYTRTHTEIKCTPHESSIHIPLLIQGPGFDQSRMIPEVVSMVDIAPSLLDAVGIKAPDSMQGKSFMPVLRSREGKNAWRQEAFIQFANSGIGRALRTPEWTYCAIDPTRGGLKSPSSTTYQEYLMYNLNADPHQLVNLCGRSQVRAISSQLRERLTQRIVEAGEATPTITPRPYSLYS